MTVDHVMDGEALEYRVARREDLEAIIGLLADDTLGRTREHSGDGEPAGSYRAAFDAIAADPNNELLVVCRGDRVVGTLQLTFTPSLSYQGSWRATIESVRTATALRSQGIGSGLVQWAIERARQRECRIVQLSTDKRRGDAKRFYERLGFRASHEGMKLHLPEAIVIEASRRRQAIRRPTPSGKRGAGPSPES